MSRWRKINIAIWKNEKFMALSPEEKLIHIYCLTAQSNRIGLFNFSRARAAEDLDMVSDTFDIEFERVCDTFCYTFDERLRVLFIPTWFKHNPPQNHKHLMGCLKDYGEIPDCNAKVMFSENLTYLQDTLCDTFLKCIGNGIAYKEKEKEKEKKREGDKKTPPTPPPNYPKINGGGGLPNDPLRPYPGLQEFYEEELPGLILKNKPGMTWPQKFDSQDLSWRTALRLLVKQDQFSPVEVIGCLRWLFSSDDRDAVFWRPNVSSFRKLRERKKDDGQHKFAKIYEQWRIAIAPPKKRGTNGSFPGFTDEDHWEKERKKMDIEISSAE